MRKTKQLPQLTVPTVALAAALAAIAPTVALADEQLITADSGLVFQYFGASGNTAGTSSGIVNTSSLRANALANDGAINTLGTSSSIASIDTNRTIGTFNTPSISGTLQGNTNVITNAGNIITITTAPGVTASMSGLFKYAGTNTGLKNVFNAAVALDTPAAANRAGAQLSPTVGSAGATQAATAPTAQVLTVAAAHMDTLRVAQAGGTGVSTGENPSYPAVWGQTFGGQATQGARDGVSGYTAKYNGLVFGSDAMFNNNWRAGGLLSYANTTVNNTGDNAGSSSRLKSYGLFGYAGYTASAWYLDLSAGAVQHKFNTQRAISFSGFTGDAMGTHDGLQYVVSAQAGRPVKLDALMPNTTVTPTAGLVYSGLRQNSYTETGGSGAALQIGATTSTSIKSDLAVKLERSFSTSYGDLVPAVQLGWRHEYKNTRLQSVSSFAADTTGATSFTSMAPTQKADTAVLGISMTLMRSKDLTLAVRFTWEGTSGYTAQTADIKVRYQF